MTKEARGAMSEISVLILMGSDSDAPIMQGAVDVLREFQIPCEMTVASAHRSPERVMRLVRDAPARGVKLFIVGAGAADGSRLPALVISGRSSAPLSAMKNKAVKIVVFPFIIYVPPWSGIFL